MLIQLHASPSLHLRSFIGMQESKPGGLIINGECVQAWSCLRCALPPCAGTTRGCLVGLAGATCGQCSVPSVDSSWAGPLQVDPITSAVQSFQEAPLRTLWPLWRVAPLCCAAEMCAVACARMPHRCARGDGQHNTTAGQRAWPAQRIARAAWPPHAALAREQRR